MSDVIHKPVDASPVKEGWATAYVNKFGDSKTLPPQNYRLSTDPRGILPTVANHSGLVDRFDDPTYYG